MSQCREFSTPWSATNDLRFTNFILDVVHLSFFGVTIVN